MPLEYRINAPLTAEQLSDLFVRATIRRPTDDLERIGRMIANANLTVTAWDSDRLVGVARCLTDFSWCCYVSDLAVDAACHRSGIGRELMRRVCAEVGDGAAVTLASAPEALEYYPKIGMEKMDNAFIIKRTR